MPSGLEPMPELNDVPARELAQLVDMLIWNGSGADRNQVATWYAELVARADRDAPHVRLAADVCMEYLAEPDSLFERKIGARVAAGFQRAT